MNIINVNFKNRYSALVSESRYQYDYGQVLLFEGLDLPPAYEVHFSNREDLGESITQIGTPDGVPVPDEMFLSGKDIYAFTYLHKGSSDGRTMYKVKIPVKKRPKPTDQEITPVEQSALDQALAAFEQAAAPLPEAARKAEAAIHTYPKIIDGHWYVWDVDTEAFVDTGVESTGEQGVGIANIVHNDDHTLTITLTNGATYTTDPVKGDKGDKGDRGLTGNGIASTNLNSNYSLTITFTDGTTYTTPPIRGKEGKAGFSPQITVGAVGENRHIVTITDASGTKSFSIYDGAQGPKGDRGDPTDVQIDGTSIVEDGVANIPLTSSLRPGVVKTSNSIASLPDGAIGVVPASVDMLKSLLDNERAITSGRLHHGVFYGLAKASGDTTQSQSDNPVGNYTDEAKTAIQNMLNVPDKDDVSAIDFSDRIAKGVDSNDNVVDGALTIGQVKDGIDGNNNPVLKNIASGKNAIAMGVSTMASGSNSFAYGEGSIASGRASTASGLDTKASGQYSLSEGYLTLSAGTGSHTEGTAGTMSAFLSGAANTKEYITTNEFLIPGLRVAKSFPEDDYIYITKVVKNQDDTFTVTLNKTLSKTEAISNESYMIAGGHALGFGTHVEGSFNVGEGMLSHIEGFRNYAFGSASHVEGESNVSQANYTHVEGSNTIATGNFQHVQGKYNVADTGNTYADIVGGGTSPINRKNIRTLDWNGNETLAGKLTIGNNPVNDMDVTTKKYVDDNLNNKIDVPETAGTSGQVLTSDGQGGQSWETPGECTVTDVQVGGTSVLENGVANIPRAGYSNFGVVTVGNGLQLINNLFLGTNKANDYQVKSGTDEYYPIVPFNQHASAFYGLAKASGDTTQSASSNPVGTYTDEAKSAIQDMLNVPDKSDITVEDVQIDGTSIVNDGVAEIPKANLTTFGVTTIDPAGGLYFTTVENKLAISRAGNSAIKTGSDGYRPIVPYSQHLSTFYGLACAAGDTTQSASSNAVGTYTEEAKSAIQSMLGIQNNVLWTESVSGTIPTITAEANTKYICGEVATLTFTPPANGTASVRFESGTTPTVLTIPNTVKFPEWFDPTELEAEKIYEILISDGTYGTVITWQA